jgi:CRP/FNR family transcriptional regulator, cyclic AMP receptor protein
MTGFEPMAVRQDWDRATERDWADLLAELPLFSQLGKRRLRKIAREAEFDEFARGDTVVLTGAPGDAFYVILSGEAEARGKPGARTLRSGDYFGEMALLDGGPRSATVVATEELHVMRLPRRSFLQLAEEDPGIARTLLAELGARVRRLEQQR